MLKSPTLIEVKQTNHCPFFTAHVFEAVTCLNTKDCYVLRVDPFIR